MEHSEPCVIFQIDQSRYRLVANALCGAVVLASVPGDRLFTVDRTGLGSCLPKGDDLKSLMRAGRMRIIAPGSTAFPRPVPPRPAGRRS